jgi:esterase/lipase
LQTIDNDDSPTNGINIDLSKVSPELSADLATLSTSIDSTFFANGVDIVTIENSIAHLSTNEAIISPIVQSIELLKSTNDNRLSSGDIVTVKVTMSKATQVSGNPIVKLNIGDSIVSATYSSGTGTKELIFTYTVATGDMDINGISLSPNAIDLNGAQLSDICNNQANLSYVEISDNSNFIVDTGVSMNIVGSNNNDTITTLSGNDIILSKLGIDTISTNGGNDIIVLVGNTQENEYQQRDITNPDNLNIDLSSVLTLDYLNHHMSSDAIDQKKIDGGDGNNTLVLYGNIDLRNIEISNIDKIIAYGSLTIGAEQVSSLNINSIVGNNTSLNISNDENTIVVDFSNITLSNFNTINIDSSTTMVVDQSDIDSVKNLLNHGTIQASTDSISLNLSGKNSNLAVKNSNGTIDTTYGNAIYISGDFLNGDEENNNLNGTEESDRLFGDEGNDVLIGGNGDDILRGGSGIDTMDGGAGDDRFVIVGDLSSGGKVDTAEDTEVLGFELSSLNGLNLNEDEDGAVEIIRGGDGEDTLYVYGTADLTNYDITGIEHIEIRSDVTFTATILNSVSSISGDGNSIVRVTSIDASDVTVDLSNLNLNGLGQIDVSEEVVILTPSIDNLGGVTSLSGAGSIVSTSGNLDLTGITRTLELDCRNDDNSVAVGGHIVENIAPVVSGYSIGNDTNDLINGSYYADIIVGSLGSDNLNGGAGNDIIYGDIQEINLDENSDDSDIENTSNKLNSIISNELVNNLGGTKGFGENYLNRNDDSSTGLINLQSVFGDTGINFFGENYNSLYVNNNGNVTFNNSTGQYTPSKIDAGISNPIIAPFWADVDTRGSSITPTSGGNSQGSNLTWYDLDTDNGIFTVTWDDVGYYSTHTDKLNAFQLQLINKDEGNFDIVFRYEDINWTTGDASSGKYGLGGSVARAGYSNGTTQGYYELPQSGNQQQMLSLDDGYAKKYSVINGLTIDDTDNDYIKGGSGNDTIIGGRGDRDVAIFSENLNQYKIIGYDNLVKVINTNNTDGIDTVYKSTEVLKFADQEIELNTKLNSAKSTETIFSDAKALSVLTHKNDLSTVSSGDDSGYYKLFFTMSAATYYHDIESLNTLPGMKDVDTDFYFKDAYNYISKDSGMTYLTPTEIGITSTPIEVSNNNKEFNIAFDDGFYLAYEEDLVDTSSVATVARSKDALFLAFRGSDVGSDWYENFTSLSAHYDRYKPLFEKIRNYSQEHNISKIYVTGHSLGGLMAAEFMEDMKNNPQYMPNIEFKAIAFEATNKFLSYEDNPNYTNFEIYGDVVPDLGLGIGKNYGHSIYLEYEGARLGVSHTMLNIANQFDYIANNLNKSDFNNDNIINKRLYVDDNNDGIISTRVKSPFDNFTLVGDVMSAFPGIMKIVGTPIDYVIDNIADEDTKEYKEIGYDIDTIYKDQSPYGILLLNELSPEMNIDNNTYYLDDKDIDAVLLQESFDSLNIVANNAQQNSILIGNNQSNILHGSNYSDIIIGNLNNNKLYGGLGNDFLYGGNQYSIIDNHSFFLDEYNISAFDNIDELFTTINYNSILDYDDFDTHSNIIYGGEGNDIIMSSEGNDVVYGDSGNDIVIFDGSFLDYHIVGYNDFIKVIDNSNDRDGHDTIFASTEILRFTDQDLYTSSFLEVLQSSSDIFTNANKLSVKENKYVESLNASDSSGYYKLFLALSIASYYTEVNDFTDIPDMGDIEVSEEKQNFYNYLHQKSGLHFLDSSEIGISSTPTSSDSNNFNIAFSNGYYIAYEDGLVLDKSSVAMINKSSDAIYLTFRGTISGSDWYDNLFDMQGHYSRYRPLFDKIDEYLQSNSSIEKVYVSGHSLGGQMAAMYMEEMKNRDDVEFKAITFEAANKPMSYEYNPNYLNFEMHLDPVPDLGVGNNYGKTIHLNYESSNLITSHFTSNITPGFDIIANNLSINDVSKNERYYLDDMSVNGDKIPDGIIETQYVSPMNNFTDVLLGTTALGIGALIAAEDNKEYLDTGYNINAVFEQKNGVLILNQLNGLTSSISNHTFVPQNDNILAVVTSNALLDFNASIDLQAYNFNHNILLVGNDGNNRISGSSFSDLLIGSGDEDKLVGNNGDDFLYGGNFSTLVSEHNSLVYNFLYSKFSSRYTFDEINTMMENVKNYAPGNITDDVTHIKGGLGADIMVGSGDNDYFYIDMNLFNNSSNVDTIYDFEIDMYTALSTDEDYLVFDASQLGMDINDDFDVVHINSSFNEYAFNGENTFLVKHDDSKVYFRPDNEDREIALLTLNTLSSDNLSGLTDNQILIYDNNSFII